MLRLLHNASQPALKSTQRRFLTSRFYDRPTLDFLLFDNPAIITPPTDDASTTQQVLDSASSFVDRYHHLDPLFDKFEPQFDPAFMNDRSSPTVSPVKMHEQVKEVLDAYSEGGFTAMHEMDLPFPSLTAVSAITGSAFTSGVLGHWVLTQCAANLLKAFGSPDLVAKYHEPLTDGRWTGTMALSETQAGSSLVDISTKATPTDTPGTYRIKGNKMWTSGADHDMTENIIHMLLAKTPDNKISLFLVPKSIVNDDGSLGERNDYTINGVNHKMGCRGISNCYWSLGDNSDGATGYLIGEEGKGLQAMFLMMNEMRIHVGLSAALCGKRGHLESLNYALERKQGRSPTTKEKVRMDENGKSIAKTTH
jgi:alkylation response protein AidB-like acyl-CoA dehydrogenase